jgi:hypothetical protein
MHIIMPNRMVHMYSMMVNIHAFIQNTSINKTHHQVNIKDTYDDNHILYRTFNLIIRTEYISNSPTNSNICTVCIT